MFAYFIACIASMIRIKENKCFSFLKFTGYLVPFLVPFFHSSVINILGEVNTFLQTRFDKIKLIGLFSIEFNRSRLKSQRA